MSIHDIRIISETEEAAEQLRQVLLGAFGADHLRLAPPHRGRRGHWLMYGSLSLPAAEVAAALADLAQPAGAPTIPLAPSTPRRRRKPTP